MSRYVPSTDYVSYGGRLYTRHYYGPGENTWAPRTWDSAMSEDLAHKLLAVYREDNADYKRILAERLERAMRDAGMIDDGATRQ